MEDIPVAAGDDITVFIHYFFTDCFFFFTKAIKHRYEFKVILTDEFLYSFRILTGTSS